MPIVLDHDYEASEIMRDVAREIRSERTEQR
jgi:hypothetical protein